MVVSYPLNSINESIGELEKNETYHIHCGGGYSSMIAASILKARGFDKVIDVAGGFASIKETGLELTEYVCPSTLA
jgi:rhodanese-related sulfurtransferase